MSDLTDYIRAQAAWRDEKAREYPEDDRNARSAEALRSLADYINNENPAAADRLEPFVPDTGPDLGGEETRHAVSRYGFGRHPVTKMHHVDLLEELRVLCLKDAYEHVRELGDDWTGVLFPFEVAAAQDDVHLPDRYWKRRAGQSEAELEDLVRSYRRRDAELDVADDRWDRET